MGATEKAERATRIVVLDSRSDRGSAALTASIARAFRDRATGVEPVEGGGAARAEARAVEDAIHAAHVAVCLDPHSLERARTAGARLAVAVLPQFDLDWPGSLEEPDLVVVAHEKLVPLAMKRGALRDRIAVAGPVAPVGYAPPRDRAALRAELGVPAELALVLVPGALLDEHGAEALFVQLALVRDGIGLVFDVGTDAETADLVRSLAPTHGLAAWMFAEEPGAERFHQLADVVLARARGPEVSRALAVGAPLVLLPAGAAEAPFVEALESLGVASGADALATLAVTIDGAVAEEALREARAAVAALDVGDGAARVAGAVQEAWLAAKERGEAAPARGLPHGLEALPREPSMPAVVAGASPATEALEQRIDRELEELKSRISRE